MHCGIVVAKENKVFKSNGAIWMEITTIFPQIILYKTQLNSTTYTFMY